MKLEFLAILLCAPLCVSASDIFVKEVMTAVPLATGVQFRESKFYVSEERAAKLPPFDPKNPDSYFPIPRALALAFDSHFAKYGVPKERFYRQVHISLEKIDDYTASAVANGVSGKSATIRNLWFYIISCEDTKVGQTKPDAGPVLVLMDGTLISPIERLRPAWPMSGSPTSAPERNAHRPSFPVHDCRA